MDQFKNLDTDLVKTLERCSWYTLHELAQELGLPTEGRIPEAIWRKSNHEPKSEAYEFMPRMGYLPYEGYPLKLVGPRPAHLEAIHQGLESAYEEIKTCAWEDLK